MLMALMLQAAVFGTPPPDPATFDKTVWGRFSRAIALRHTREEVAIAHERDDAQPTRPTVRLRLTVHEPGGQTTVYWADSRTCPVAQEIAERFLALPMPRPDPPRPPSPEDSVIIMDGIGYAVTLPVGYGRGSIADPATFTSNVGTPLATWVEGSFAALRPCWPGSLASDIAFRPSSR
jgi:hypothetical protein